jgi:hypothetical protein
MHFLNKHSTPDMALTMNTTDFWHVTPCSLVNTTQGTSQQCHIPEDTGLQVLYILTDRLFIDFKLWVGMANSVTTNPPVLNTLYSVDW